LHGEDFSLSDDSQRQAIVSGKNAAPVSFGAVYNISIRVWISGISVIHDHRYVWHTLQLY
jgi:hypothetical protein